MRRSKKKRGASQSKAAKGKGKSKDDTPTHTPTARASTKRKQKAKSAQISKGGSAARRSTAPTPAPAAPAVVPPARYNNHALPNPNVHHRHRPVPLFPGPTAPASAVVGVRVERLQRAPQLFAPNETVPTNAYASALPVTCRVGKAWGASVGAGPVWQLVEDLGWFREAVEAEGVRRGGADGAAPAPAQVCDERARRPRVHAGVALQGWAVLIRAECVLPSSFLSQRSEASCESFF
jgi:transcription factor C subunit 6